MRRTAAFVATVVLVAGLVGAGLAPAAAQTSGNATVDCSYPITVTDANGVEVTIQDEPDRVVTLAPSASQVMWAIGAREKVVGMPVNPYTAYLNGSREKTDVVNDQLQPQIETIVGLEPDLVLAPNIISNDTVEQLRSAGITVYRFEQAASVRDVVAKTRLTGRLVGEYDNATQVSARTLATLRAYRNATADETQPTVYYAMGGGYTAGPQTFIGDVIAAAGGQNIARSANISTYGVINTETVVNLDPDWIVVPEGRPVPYGPAMNETTAIQQGHIVRVNNNFISQPGPRVVQPLQTLAQTFHPDVSAAVTVDPSTVSAPICAANAATPTVTTNPTPTASQTATASPTPSETTTVELTVTNATLQSTGGTETTTTSGPGFGVVSGLLALIASGALARRH